MVSFGTKCGDIVYMETLTLDTNVLRDWAWAEGLNSEVRYINQPEKRNSLLSLFQNLKQLRDGGICELGITNQLYTDFAKDPNELPAFLHQIIGPYVQFASISLSTFPMSFPNVFSNESEVMGIFKDVFPDSKPEHKKYKKNRKDALQLYAHRINRRDIFLTTDTAILNARDILLEKWQIRVMDLREYIEMHKDYFR